MIKHNVYYALIAFLLLLSMASVDAVDLANIPPVKQSSCIELIQTCSNCTFVNITGIHYPSPNSSIIYFNKAMTKNNNIYNYTFCDTHILGQYIYDTIGNPDAVVTTQSVTFEVTATGQTLDLSKTILYIVIFILALGIFLFSLIGGFMIPSKNNTDEMTGYIIAVSNVKYIKMLAFGIAYIMLMLIFYFMWMISYSFLNMDFITNLSKIAFYTFAWGCVIFFPLLIYFSIANAVRDHKVADMLQRGFRVKDE